MEVVVGDDTLPVSGDGYNFCAPRYIGDLVSSLDFQILSTVNNHSYDRGLEGLVSTINYFKDNTSIKTVGTYLNDDDKNNYSVLDINGIKFGFLAYTYGTNMRVNSAERNMVSVYRNPDTRKFDDIAKENIKKEVLAVLLSDYKYIHLKLLLSIYTKSEWRCKHIMNTGERLRQLREQYRLSQNDVAKVLQVTTSLISSYEHGERTPSPSKLVQLADLYHTTTDYLLCRNNSYDDTIFLSLNGLSSRQIVLIRELVETMRIL